MKKTEEEHLNNLQRFPKEQGTSHAGRYDYRNFHITLKQWKMLHAVVDCGGFADAAEYLHISQSAVSYTVSKLQEQLGIPVLKIEGRKAHLTEAGRELLERSRHLIRDAVELELCAENLRQGRGLGVRLAVAHDFPTELLMTALRRVTQLRWNTRISLVDMGWSQVEKALIERTVDLVITKRVPPGFHGSPLLEIEYVPVSHPDHPLFQLKRDISAADLEWQVQIVIGGIEDEWQDFNDGTARLPQHWNVNSFDTAIGMLCEGMAYAWMPRHRVEPLLNKGALAILPIHQGGLYKTSFYLIHGRTNTPGSGVSAFAELLQHVAGRGRQRLDDGHINLKYKVFEYEDGKKDASKFPLRQNGKLCDVKL